VRTPRALAQPFVFHDGIQGVPGPSGPPGPTGPGVAVGGATGQVLAKTSATDYATEWVTPTPVGAQYVTLATDSTLINERVLAAGTGITVTDGGAGSTVTVATSAILPTIIDAKGDLIVGTAADTASRLAVGTSNNQVLTVDSSTGSGLKWADPALSGAGAIPFNTSGAYLAGDRFAEVANTTSDYASTPDSAALDVTGDIEVVFKAKMLKWNRIPNLGNASLISKRATSQDAYQVYINTNTAAFEFRWWQGATFKNLTSSVSIPFSDGETGWVKITLDVDNGSSQHEVKFYTANDQASEPTVWTQLGITRVGAGVTSVASTTAPLWIGVDNFGALGSGDYYRVIIRNGIDGTAVFDANFASATANALAFAESSSNAATVTINTTRYTYGLPNIQWNTSNVTQALTINRVHYQPFLVSSPIVVDGTQFHVTSGPASSANVRTGIYRADSNMQPTGAPVLDAGNTVVGTSATGTFFTQVTPVTLQPGMYLTAINTSVALTCRVQRGGIVGTDIGAGTSSIISLMYAAQTQGALPNPGTAWNTRTFSTTSPNHYLFLRWSPA